MTEQFVSYLSIYSALLIGTGIKTMVVFGLLSFLNMRGNIGKVVYAIFMAGAWAIVVGLIGIGISVVLAVGIITIMQWSWAVLLGAI